jgi:hypothetical protein
MKKSVLTIAALSMFSVGQVMANSHGGGVEPVDSEANYSTTLTSFWLTPDSHFSLLNIPMLPVVVKEGDHNHAICFKDITLAWDLNAPGIQFNVLQIGDEVPASECPMPARPMLPPHMQ